MKATLYYFGFVRKTKKNEYEGINGLTENISEAIPFPSVNSLTVYVNDAYTEPQIFDVFKYQDDNIYHMGCVVADKISPTTLVTDDSLL